MKTIGKIQYITNGNSFDAIVQEVSEVLEAGGDWIQLRIKNVDLDRKAIALKVKQMCEGKATFIVNDDVELAIETNADGVHLGKNDMDPTEARQLLGDDKIIGGTANTLTDCKNLEMQKVDYIGLGPLRYTKTKKNLSPILGIETYEKIFPIKETYGWTFGKVNTPVVAIGGIKEIDIEDLVSKTNIYGIAVSGLLSNSKEKKALLDRIKLKLWKN